MEIITKDSGRSISVSDEIFSHCYNEGVIHQAVTTSLNNDRSGNSAQKTRAEVRGGGKKPWKQKGTGRARVGSSRSPIWVGGGITFGPTNQKNFSQTLPKKMAIRAKAELRRLLHQEDRILRVPSLHLDEPKTKSAVRFLASLKPKGRTLMITQNLEAELILATANIPRTDVKVNSQVSILDLAMYQTIIMEQSCFDLIFDLQKTVKKTSRPVAKEVEK